LDPVATAPGTDINGQVRVLNRIAVKNNYAVSQSSSGIVQRRYQSSQSRTAPWIGQDFSLSC